MENAEQSWQLDVGCSRSGKDAASLRGSDSRLEARGGKRDRLAASRMTGWSTFCSIAARSRSSGTRQRTSCRHQESHRRRASAHRRTDPRTVGQGPSALAASTPWSHGVHVRLPASEHVGIGDARLRRTGRTASGEHWRRVAAVSVGQSVYAVPPDGAGGRLGALGTVYRQLTRHGSRKLTSPETTRACGGPGSAGSALCLRRTAFPQPRGVCGQRVDRLEVAQAARRWLRRAASNGVASGCRREQRGEVQRRNAASRHARPRPPDRRQPPHRVSGVLTARTSTAAEVAPPRYRGSRDARRADAQPRRAAAERDSPSRRLRPSRTGNAARPERLAELLEAAGDARPQACRTPFGAASQDPRMSYQSRTITALLAGRAVGRAAGFVVHVAGVDVVQAGELSRSPARASASPPACAGRRSSSSRDGRR